MGALVLGGRMPSVISCRARSLETHKKFSITGVESGNF